ncbi:MAG: transporter related, partial [Firmicutes bacterium]|nr:transporter related [Bacillota bacterium]
SLEDGAVDYWDANYRDYQIASLYHAFKYYGLPSVEGVPVKDYSRYHKVLLLYGVESEEIKQSFPELLPPKTVASGRFEGIYTTLWRRMSERGGDAKKYNRYFYLDLCPECNGERLNSLSRKVTVEDVRLPQLSLLSLDKLLEWVKQLDAGMLTTHRELVESYLEDLTTKLDRIKRVGLGYLTLDRQTITLSGGELQRIKLAAALASDLTGIIYIMDEPTIGLHPQDTEGMIHILKQLRDKENTVIVIEHDTDVMEVADYIVDIGPGSGKQGGEIVGSGSLKELMLQASSVTGTYLRRKDQHRDAYRKGNGDVIQIHRANLNNLQDIDVSFPCGCLTTVTGVSGSGKSTLIFEVLTGEEEKQSSTDDLGQKNRVSGIDVFDQIITIEQAAISRMKRSNVATYSDVYSEIRTIFGGLREAKAKGLTAKHFSFNTKGGRCENCEGLGSVTNNMLFFADVEVTCPICGGKRFNEEVLAVTYQGYNINDILNLNAREALEVFRKSTKITSILSLLIEVGLDYLELGQSVTTISGGESQRLKLAKELVSSTGKRNLYLMDEPTTGLHPIDVEHFLVLLNRLVEAGNTVIVVEHNQQVIKASDWIVDLGPGGGDQGGNLVFEGTPEEMMKNSRTATAEYLRQS